jgi:hydrogenase expression/formation protein HypC
MCLAIPAKIIELLPNDMARVELDGVFKNISLSLVEGAQLGDYVILHVGYALQLLDAAQAAETLALFSELERQA